MCALVTGVQTCALPIVHLVEPEQVATTQLDGVDPDLACSDVEEHLAADGLELPRAAVGAATGRVGEHDLGGEGGARDPVGPGEEHPGGERGLRSEEHTSELQSLMRISYAVFCMI